jgi:hypothetical protein
VTPSGYLVRNSGVAASDRIGVYPPSGRICCCGRSSANLANAQAPEAFVAPRGMHRLSPPSKKAVPPSGPHSSATPVLARMSSSASITTAL